MKSANQVRLSAARGAMIRTWINVVWVVDREARADIWLEPEQSHDAAPDRAGNVHLRAGDRRPGLPESDPDIGLYGAGVPRLPDGSDSVSVFCSLTNAQGKGTIRLEVGRLLPDEADPDEESVFYFQEGEIVFPSRHAIVHAAFRIRSLVFPQPGVYEIRLRVDGESIVARRLRVYQRGE